MVGPYTDSLEMPVGDPRFTPGPGTGSTKVESDMMVVPTLVSASSFCHLIAYNLPLYRTIYSYARVLLIQRK
jgi:hypothetical protein